MLKDKNLYCVGGYIRDEILGIKNFDIDYDKLITHCCNKLNGNIDGIEINLKEEENDN